MNSKKLSFLTVIVSVCIWLIILTILMFSDYAKPRIEYFSGQAAQISPQEGQLRFRFSHLMNRKSVEEGLQISPAYKGTFSWSGRVMTWTSTSSLNYGEKLNLTLSHAQDQEGRILADQSFLTETTPLTMSYLVTNGPEMGRVKTRTVLASGPDDFLTPKGYFVRDYAISPDGKWIAFLANRSGKETYTDKSTFYLYLSNIATKRLISVQAIQDQVLDNLRWYPDSTAIAFSYFSLKGDEEGLEAYFPASQELIKLADKKARAYPFYFSPDSSKIAYVDINGALILGDVPSGEGNLIATTFNDVFGFDENGKFLGYILPSTLDPFDLKNNPVLLEANGSEQPLKLDEYTSFDINFIPQTTSLVLSLEKDTGNLRDDGIAMYDYKQNKLTPITSGESGTDVMPIVSPDGSVIVWQRFQNNNQGYVLTGWNDYQGILVGGEIFMKDLISGETKSLGISGSNIQFIP